VTRPPPRAVFDCNIYLQAIINPTGPAGACLAAAWDGRTRLICSDFVLLEIADLAAKPALVARFGITAERVQMLIDSVHRVALFYPPPEERFVYPRDPDDAHYINLALAAEAAFVVSRDNDLLALMDPADPAGRDFLQRFPTLRILTPPAFLATLDAAASR
jgi:putative PIN family toxin of toxin-antitoxin system